MSFITRQTQVQTIDESLRRQFEAAWLAGKPLAIEECLPRAEDPRFLATLEELVHIDLEFAWRAGTEAGAREAAEGEATVPLPPGVESYLARFPQLNQPGIVLRLLQQEALVRRRCGDRVVAEEYRRRFPEIVPVGAAAESLLGLSGGAPGEPLAAEPPSHAGQETPAKATGSQFGNYELLEEIGRGGMGVVYRARQCTADRIVALKVIRADSLEALPGDTRRVAMDRFLHEAQATARLDHPNMVTVHEVGQVGGQPFYSMRYVEGRSLADMLRDGPMEGRRAAAYLEPVARAVHEAHQHGVLHRDLKPANILVDRRTDQAMVVDFGLAKLARQDQELTRHGDVMGTPPYMPPEQAIDAAAVTALSDVYALGATLYHLVTGRPPFQAATAVETLRQVVDEEPAPPRRVNPSIDRDLETICLKCLQKEGPRRYGSAALLADDLRRYLRGEPILARPVGIVERVWRWGRRNPLTAALIASTLGCLMLALAATAVGYVKTSAALGTAERALNEAEARFRREREAVDNFFTRVSENTLLNEPGFQPLRKELLVEALKYYQRFLAERGEDPSLRDELARTHFRVGCITEEIDSPERAAADYDRARRMQEELVAETPADATRLRALGDTLNALGRANHRLHRLDEAREAYRQAVAVRTRLAEAGPREHEFRRMLANSLMNMGLVEKARGEVVEAEGYFQRAQTLRKEILAQSPGDAHTLGDYSMGSYNLGILALERGEAPAAAKHVQEAAAGFEALLASDPRSLANQYRLAVCDRILADVHTQSGQPAAARALYQKALDRMEKLARASPDVPEYTSALAGLYMNLGQLEHEQGAGPAALKSYQQTAAIFEELVRKQPEVPKYRRDLAVALRSMAKVQAAAGDRPAARADVTAARRHFEILVQKYPANREYQQLLAETDAQLAEFARDKPEPPRPQGPTRK